MKNQVTFELPKNKKNGGLSENPKRYEVGPLFSGKRENDSAAPHGTLFWGKNKNSYRRSTEKSRETFGASWGRLPYSFSSSGDRGEGPIWEKLRWVVKEAEKESRSLGSTRLTQIKASDVLSSTQTILVKKEGRVGARAER